MPTNCPTSATAADQHTARFAAADPAAIREAYQTYGWLAYAVAYRILGDVGRAEDAVTQTFLQAWREAGNAGWSRAPGPWLARIARRAASEASASQAPSLEEIYDMWEVLQALQDLPAEDRELIRLQHHGELSPTEIAAKLSMPPAAVPFHMLRAHRRLARLLGRLRVLT